MELSDEKEHPESRADGERGETELLDEKKLPKSRANGEHELPDETAASDRVSRCLFLLLVLLRVMV